MFCDESLVLAAARWLWFSAFVCDDRHKANGGDGETAHSPHDHDDEVQQIPAVPQVGVGVEEQAVGYHLEERLHREDDEEEVLHTLLETHSRMGEGGGVN